MAQVTDRTRREYWFDPSKQHKEITYYREDNLYTRSFIQMSKLCVYASSFTDEYIAYQTRGRKGLHLFFHLSYLKSSLTKLHITHRSPKNSWILILWQKFQGLKFWKGLLGQQAICNSLHIPCYRKGGQAQKNVHDLQKPLVAHLW